MAFSLCTWACDQLKPITGQWITLKNTSPQWVVHLSPQYSHVTLVSGHLFLTAVNWPINMEVHKEVHHQVKHRLYMPWTPR